MKRNFDFSKIFDPDFLDMNKGPKIDIKPIQEFPVIEKEKPKPKKQQEAKKQQEPKKQQEAKKQQEPNLEQQLNFQQEHFISDKKALRKAIILSEILQKPVSKRR